MKTTSRILNSMQVTLVSGDKMNCNAIHFNPSDHLYKAAKHLLSAAEFLKRGDCSNAAQSTNLANVHFDLFNRLS